MSSTDFRGLRPAVNDPMLQFLVEMQKQVIQAITQGQVDLVDSDNEDIYADGQDVDTVIKLHADLSSARKFASTDFEFYPGFEPDGNQLKLWLLGRSLGSELPDKSTFYHNAIIEGDPTLIDGVIDLGYATTGAKSIAMKFNRPTSLLLGEEWLQIPDATDLQVIGLTTGFSVFMRIKLLDNTAQGGKDPTIIAKIDDSTPSNAFMVQIKPDGKVLFIVTRAGVNYAKETAINTVTAGGGTAVRDIMCTYTISGNVQAIHVDGVNKTLTTFAGGINYQTDLSNHDMFLFKRGAGDNAGYVYCDFFDFRYYRNRIVTATESLQLYNNKWTISNIAFRHVMLTDYYASS